MSDETKRVSAIATPEDLALAREVTKLQEHVRDDVIPQIDRARYAELAGEVWDFAGYAGVDVPKPYKKLIGALASFGPMIKYIPGYDGWPSFVRDAFEKILEGANLANRTFVE